MDRREAIKILEGFRYYIIHEDTNEALDLAIEALKGDLHCPKCGTIVRDGRQYHDLVYRGEAEPKESQGERMTRIVHELSGCDAESATTTDCISRAEQVTRKLKNPCDSLLKADSDECKEQKSKLDCISRADAIAYIDRVTNSGLGKNKSLDYIRKYISALPSVTPIAKTQQADTLIIADALRSFALDCGRHVSDRKRAGELREQVLAYGASMCQPVTPTERTGEWISLFDGNEWFIHCSKCKTQHYEEDLLMGGSELPNFCPNCGAKMGEMDNE